MRSVHALSVCHCYIQEYCCQGPVTVLDKLTCSNIVNFERKMSEFIAMYFCNSLNSVYKPEEYHGPFDEGFA